MADPYTLRILSFDGGGQRGYLSLKFLELFIQQWGVNPAKLAEQFDVITGNSIGGIMGLAFAFGKTPAEITPFFTEQGPYIFSLSSLIPSLRPNLVTKLALVAANTPFYQSSGPTENQYGAGLLKTVLQQQFGNATMQNLKTNVVIPSYRSNTSTYVLFSNLDYLNFIGQTELISNVALCTSAAPAYLPPIILNDNNTYIDGGVYMNNPADFGRNLAKMIKPTAKRCCILSLGTGIGALGFDDGDSVSADSTIELLFKLFNIAATGGQESVNKNLFLESTYTLEQLYYYRFQPKLDLTLNTELDNTDSQILTYYQNTATDVFNNDIDNIVKFIGHLTA